MSEKVETTDKDREENINKDMQAMKQRYDTEQQVSESGNENGHNEQGPG